MPAEDSLCNIVRIDPTLGEMLEAVVREDERPVEPRARHTGMVCILGCKSRHSAAMVAERRGQARPGAGRPATTHRPLGGPLRRARGGASTRRLLAPPRTAGFLRARSHRQ